MPLLRAICLASQRFIDLRYQGIVPHRGVNVKRTGCVLEGMLPRRQGEEARCGWEFLGIFMDICRAVTGCVLILLST
jgi:hypothetical protein